MIIQKITTGFVIQKFDTKTNQFVSQEFIAGDQVEHEDENGEFVDNHDYDIDNHYMQFNMKQPNLNDYGDTSKIKTLRDLKDHLNQAVDDVLDQDIAVHLETDDEYFSASNQSVKFKYQIIPDVLDAGHFVIVVSQ